MQSEANAKINLFIIPEVLKRFNFKDQDYGDAFKLLGEKGQFSDINRKFWKLYNAIWLGRELVGEQPDEIAEDIIGHCLLLIYLLRFPPDAEGPMEKCLDDDFDSTDEEGCDDAKDSSPEYVIEKIEKRCMNLEERLKDRTMRVIELERVLSDYGITDSPRLSAPENLRSSPSAAGLLIDDERGTRDARKTRDIDHEAKMQAIHVYEMIIQNLDRDSPSRTTAIWHGICDAFNIDRTERPNGSY